MRIVAILASALLGGLLVVGLGAPGTTPAHAAGVQAPNIVIVVTDDQRVGTLKTMPIVRHELRQPGASYVGVIPTSMCCPSRTALLSGNLSHHTGVYANVLKQGGGWPTFNASGYESKTLATALQAAGYRTGLVGKYLNEWNRAPDGFVPPGWDVFRALYVATGQGASAYYNYELRGTEPTEVFGATAADYSTDVEADRAVQFITQSPPDAPLFLMYTPTAPHSPYIPAPRYVNSWSPSAPYRNDAVNEADMSDKPPFMRDLSPVSLREIDHAQDKTGETLRAVDDGVGALIDALGPRMSNTLFIFMSDNGVMWGEHRLEKKNRPYRWSTDVPMIMRWDGHLSDPPGQQLVSNVDVTQTVLDAAGIPHALNTEGMSVLRERRSETLLESEKSQAHPAYCGVRTVNWLYVKYSGRHGKELYDYRTDPLELNNVANLSQYAAKRAELHDLAKTLCTPTPPGFRWS